MNYTMRLISDNDQDLAACQEWWMTASDEAKNTVWSIIQTHYNDPAMEVMSRFAQLAFTQMFLASVENKGESP